MRALVELLEHHGIKQVEVARALEVTEAAVSKILRGEFDPRKERIDRLLAFLSRRLGRPVTYEEVFGPPDLPAAANQG